ncbi:uncharacterized protein TNCV_3154171 [Trichonephila clavipes]|nr:uncharacterized protein TNCV_3154171 [Trichonephila clavipes]
MPCRKQRSAFDQVSEFDRRRIVDYRDCGLSFREIGSRVGRNQTTDLRSDTAFNEMLCDASELNDEIDILANFELTQPRHRVRRNVNFDYEAQDDPIEDPTLKYKTEFYFFTLDKKLSIHLNPDTPQNDKLKYCKDLETVLTLMGIHQI